MAVKIRLTRIGKKKVPFYRVIVIDGRSKRSGRSLELIGSYNALAGTVTHFNDELFKKWIAQGAVETDAVKKIRLKWMATQAQQAA